MSSGSPVIDSILLDGTDGRLEMFLAGVIDLDVLTDRKEATQQIEKALHVEEDALAKE